MHRLGYRAKRLAMMLGNTELMDSGPRGFARIPFVYVPKHNQAHTWLTLACTDLYIL
jgi:hypothetical protein